MAMETTPETTIYADWHLDVYVPESDAKMGLPEIKGFDSEAEDLVRHPNMGPNNEYHTNRRLGYQMGVTGADLKRVGATDITQLTPEQYDEILFGRGGAIPRIRRGLIGASIWFDWKRLSVEEQERNVTDLAARYRSLEERFGVRFVQAGQNVSADGTNVLLVLEGLNFITADNYKQQINGLVDAGIRSVNPMYNSTNSLGNSETGLTPLGIMALSELMTGGIYDPDTGRVSSIGQRPRVFVDLAHMPPVPRGDAIRLAQKLQDETGEKVPLFYTHGAPEKFMAGDPDFGSYGAIRGLRDDEVDTLIRNGWGFGYTASRPFFQNIEAVVDCLKDIYDRHGHIKNVVIGSDSGGTNPTWDIGANTPAGMARLRELLIYSGIPAEDVNGIYIGNALDLIAQK